MNYLDKLVQTSDEDYERALVLKALEYVETSYRDASLGELSAMLNQSVSRLSRLISRQTGRSFFPAFAAGQIPRRAKAIAGKRPAGGGYRRGR